MKKYIKDLSVEQFIENLKQGEILYGTAGTYEMINGIIVHKDGDNWAVCPLIRKDYEYYFDRPEPEINITVGEFYKTRNGLKAYAYTSAANDRIAVVVENQMPYTVSNNGYVSDEAETDLDLVAPYTQETPKKPYGKRHKYNDKELKAMIKQGLTYQDICNKLGVGYTTLARHIANNKDLYNIYKYRRK